MSRYMNKCIRIVMLWYKTSLPNAFLSTTAMLRVISAVLLFGNMKFQQDRKSDQATLPDNTGDLHLLIDFTPTVKAVTLIFISGRGSAISSAKQGKSGPIYNLAKN